MLTDVPVERLMRTAALGGWPCPYVAIADFDGDGNLDRALLLKHKTEPTVRLIVAHNEAGKWRIELQKDWPIAIADAQVEPLEAGLYEQAKGGRDAVQEIDNLKSIQSDRAGFLGGPAIGTKQAFFSINGEWQSIRLED